MMPPRMSDCGRLKASITPPRTLSLTSATRAIVPPSSSSVTNCGSAKIARAPSAMSIPGSSAAIPKLKRYVIPDTGSGPIIPSSNPMQPIIKPRMVSPFEAMEINASAAIPRTKYSGAPIIKAKAVIGAASRTKENQPRRPPTKEAPVAIPRAVPALPFRVIG